MASLEDERIERDPVAPGETDLDNAPRDLPAYLKILRSRDEFGVHTNLKNSAPFGLSRELCINHLI
jgi:hypothetical protein